MAGFATWLHFGTKGGKITPIPPLITVKKMESISHNSVVNVQFRLSWVAYIKPVLFACLLVFIGMIFKRDSNLFFICMCAAAVLYFFYTAAYLRKVSLFFDRSGVWIYTGVFPWNSGISGMRWRDIEDASYTPGLLNWIFRSYSISVNHRFAGKQGLSVFSVHHGDKAAMMINEQIGHYLNTQGSGYGREII